jgi:hypothetical protein
LKFPRHFQMIMIVLSLVGIALVLIFGRPTATPTAAQTQEATAVPTSRPQEGHHWCGDGPVEKLNPSEAQKNGYLLYTVANTNGALKSDHIRAIRMLPKYFTFGAFIGYAGELEDNLSFITPQTIETCRVGDQHIVGHVNDVLSDWVYKNTWITTDGSNVYRITSPDTENKPYTFKHYGEADGLSEGRGYQLVLHGSDLYDVTYTGIFLYNRKTDKWSKVSDLFESTLPMNWDTMFWDDSTNSVWLGSIDGGIQRRFLAPDAKQKWVTYRHGNVVGWDDLTVVPELPSSNKIRMIKQAPDGRIWIACDPGIVIFDPKTQKWERIEFPIKDGWFTVVDFDHLGRSWVTGNGGTWMFQIGSDDAYWDGGLSLDFGTNGGVFGEDEILVGTDGFGLYIGKIPPK